MKRTLLPLLALLTLVSCNWISGDDVKSRQAEIADNLNSKETTEVLYLLGRPSLEYKDTAAGIVVDVLRFEDSFAIKRAFPYKDVANEEELFLEAAFKDGKCFDVKTNLATYVISPVKYNASILEIVIMCSILLIIASIYLISLISANINIVKNKAISNAKEKADIEQKLSSLASRQLKIEDTLSSDNTLISRSVERQDAIMREINNLSSRYENLRKEFNNIVSVKTDITAKSILLAEKLLETTLQSKGSELVENQQAQETDKGQPENPETSPQEKVHLTEQQIAALDMKIQDCGISVRLFNVLKALDMNRLGDIVSVSRAGIFKTRNFGRKTLAELDNLLERNNLYFGMDLSDTGFKAKS